MPASGYGLREPAVVPWRPCCAARRFGCEPGTLVRIDSPGEDAEADALLRGPGEPSRVGGGARWHAAFTAGTARVRGAVDRTPGAVLLADVGEIAVMFDKRLCHARLSAAGVPVPAALPGPVGGYAELRERMGEAGWGRVFVKPAHGSSASGVVALQTPGHRIKAVTSAELSAGGLYNSLRVRSYEDEADWRRSSTCSPGTGSTWSGGSPRRASTERRSICGWSCVDGTPPTPSSARAGPP